MMEIRISGKGKLQIDQSSGGKSLLNILRANGFDIYAPCGGKGTCGKCRVSIKGEGEILACEYYPDKDIEVILPGEEEAVILVHQTKFLEDLPFQPDKAGYSTSSPYGVAIDIGTTTVVLYFLNLRSGQIEKISSFLNPQRIYGGDVITRITFCQEHAGGLAKLHKSIVEALNGELEIFIKHRKLLPENIEKIIVAGNTTMLHLLLGEDPVSIALAPFKPMFTEKQVRKGYLTGLNMHPDGELVTLPSVSAFVGADITAGLAALNAGFTNYLFLDLGTNGELALVKGDEILACATAAGPAFEGASLSCGIGAVAGAVSSFNGHNDYQVIGNTIPRGICGSGIIDIVAWMLQNDLIDESGNLENDFVIHAGANIYVSQQDIREIQLAKSAVYSGIKVMLDRTVLSFSDVDALFLAGGFGNYINVASAMQIGLLPYELKDRIFAIGNSAGIGALEYLKNPGFEEKVCRIIKNTRYIELSDSDEFTMEFALNMNFTGKE